MIKNIASLNLKKYKKILSRGDLRIFFEQD